MIFGQQYDTKDLNNLPENHGFEFCYKIGCKQTVFPCQNRRFNKNLIFLGSLCSDLNLFQMTFHVKNVGKRNEICQNNFCKIRNVNKLMSCKKLAQAKILKECSKLFCKIFTFFSCQYCFKSLSIHFGIQIPINVD